MRDIFDINRDIKKAMRDMDMHKALKFAKEREEYLKSRKIDNAR